MITNNKIVFCTKFRLMSGMIPASVLKLEFKHKLSFIGFSHDMFSLFHISILLFLTSFFYSCTKSPEPINYGKDECEYCRMMITDKKYGSEIITVKGKIYKFDSIECLIEFSLEKNIAGDVNQMFFTTNFSKPEELINAANAFYIHNDNFRSPMGLNVSAFKSESELNSFHSANGGTKLTWIDVIELVKQRSM